MLTRPKSSAIKSFQNKLGQNQQSVNPNAAQNKREMKVPTLSEFIKNRDWTGAIALIEFEKPKERTDLLYWLAYCYFHAGEYQKAYDLYDQLTKKPDYDKELHVFKACCLYGLTNYDDAKKECQKGDETPLKIRVMFHVAHKLNDESLLMEYHHKLGDNTLDQLCLAAVHYLRGHHEEATEIYRKLMTENREHHAINFYTALCYYKLDYYDVSLELLSSYLSSHADSVMGVNLKACNHFQLYNGKAAEAELRTLQNSCKNGLNIFQENDILKHNLVVFRGGENALQVLPPLVDIIPEARLNLVIYYLKNDDVEAAAKLMEDRECSSPKEYILKGTIHAIIAQNTDSTEEAQKAQKLLQLVGSSATECDTIPGRQSMGTCFFLMKMFEDCLVYLNSIKEYMETEDEFNWNYGIACAARGDYKVGEEALLSIQNERYTSDYIYISWLARCYIMNGNPNMAWELYLCIENSNQSYSLLQVLANDFYKMGHFYFAFKAFDVLERVDPDPEFWEGKRGAAVGVFQMVIAGKESKEKLNEIIELLKNSGNPQVEYIIRVVRKWAKENGMAL
eukprot:CAMPEP_0115006664 /NCGR_PEP_ID=MMETSP0216-20121206/20646_1 /TAXON_ID=223996 /ORGANISM="Protocruzia adherens, Strain Boccale" /LENGTH=564 /DNA_ID=CAMNT_0002373313 /DNA_START=18 /DNA_END=1712 /DNA_ORIENTATION=+